MERNIAATCSNWKLYGYGSGTSHLSAHLLIPGAPFPDRCNFHCYLLSMRFCIPYMPVLSHNHLTPRLTPTKTGTLTSSQ